MSDSSTAQGEGRSIPATPPRIPAHQWRLLLPLLLMLLTGASYWLDRARGAAEDVLRFAVAQQSALAARVAASATRAANGEGAAFADLRRDRTRAAAARSAKTLTLTKSSSLGEMDRIRAKLDALAELWRRVDGDAERLLNIESAIAAVRDDVEAFQSIATGILVTADELVDAMVSAEEPPEQLRAASRQLLLIQRISANVRRVLEGGEGVITAADRFGRDAVLFGEMNNALLIGNPELGIQRVGAGPAREILVGIGREFRRGADLIEEIMARAVAVADAKARADAIVRDAAQIAGLGGEIEAWVSATRASRGMWAATTEILGALALLSLVVTIGQIAAKTRRARIEAREHSQKIATGSADQAAREAAIEAREVATETALGGLVEELDRLSRGETLTGLESSVSISDTSLAPLEMAVAAVRRRLVSLAQAATRMSSGGRRFVNAASKARAVAEEQSRQVEQAAATTRIMAAQVESVADHGRASGAVAQQSLESTKHLAAVIEEAGGQAQQTLFSAKSAAARIRQLNDSTRQIQVIAQTVDELSEQCRMLSLNISIRASLAEDSGSEVAARFAEDVQKLASDARRALKRIESVNEDVRAHAGNAADSVKQVMWAAENSAEKSRTALKEASGVATLAQRLSATHQDLTDALEEHTVRMTEVVKAATSVHGVSGRVRAEIRDCVESAGRLAQLAGVLESTLTRYDSRPELNGSVIELPAMDADARAPLRADDQAEVEGPKQVIGQDPP